VEIFPQRSHFVLGQLLKEKEVSKSGYNNFDTEVKQLDSSDKNLSDYGLSKYESSTFQKIATLPEDEFEGELAKGGGNVKNYQSSRLTSKKKCRVK